jgi:cell division septal protein FtsQ
MEMGTFFYTQKTNIKTCFHYGKTNKIMNTVFLVYTNGDFDVSVVVGVGTDIVAAENLIKRVAKDLGYSVYSIGDNKFKRQTSHDHSSEYDYWIEEVKVNKPL